VAGDWRRLHNEEPRNFCASPNVIRAIKSRKIRWAGLVAQMREMRNAYINLIGKSEGRKPLGRPWRRWEDNMRMDLNGSRMGKCGLDEYICLRLVTSGGLL
jgi:hypothetical protein